MAAPRKGYRACAGCGRNRALKFFKPAGVKCSTCLRKRTRHASRATRLMETYGITEDEYAILLARFDGRCWVCKGKRPYNLDVDHDHVVEKNLLALGWSPQAAARASIRGLGCKVCNRRLLPSCHDDVTLLHAAIEYLLHARSSAQTLLMREASNAHCGDGGEEVHTDNGPALAA